ncbi:hypothetical protein [Bacteroides propionicifaciens]|uniref:hypothetical protein n=1 Tax=Bacteroides propionicifaciens TaxID=392838 RepID=UPI001EE2A0B8|nr:hypothetical protein [Bacteroides propionicifaciens]
MNYKYKFCIWLVDSLLNNKRSMTFKKIQEKWKDSSFNPNGEVLTLRSSIATNRMHNLYSM